MSVRTTVELEKIGSLLEGRHENPFDVLGPHEIVVDGRRALAVRAFLPDSNQAWVVDPAHSVSQPMRRIHPAGLYEAICPMLKERVEPSLSYCAWPTSAERRAMHARSLRLSAAADRVRPVLARRRAALEQLQQAGRPTAHDRRRRGRQFRRLGAQRHGRQRRSATSTPGTAAGIPCASTFPAASGNCSCPAWAKARSTSIQIRHHDQVFEKSDPYGFAAEAAAAHGLEGGRSRPLPLARRGVDRQAAARPTGSSGRCRSTKSTWAVGGGRATTRRAG